MVLVTAVFIVISCALIVSGIDAAPANTSDINELLQAEKTERLRLENEMNTLSDKLSEIDNRMQRDAYWMPGKTKYSFTATRSNDVAIYNQQTLVFDKVHNNMGDVYNPTFGHFTVPVNGTYLISITIIADPGELLNMHLMKDTTSIYWFYFGDSSNAHREAESVNLVLELTQDDVLYVQGRSSPDYVEQGSAFTGVLLHI